MIQKTGLDLYHDPQLTNHHMNAWMKLLENASRRFCCSYSGATPMVVFQNSFFFSKLEQLQHEQVVSRWFKTVDVGCMFRMGYLVFFVHAPAHWFLAVICFRQHEICFLDSIPKDHQKWFDCLMHFLVYLAKGMEFDPSEWTKVEVDVPCQENVIDCGVFACMFMLHFVAGTFQNIQPSFPFNQNNMVDIRYAMSFAFLQNSIFSVLEEWFLQFYTDQQSKASVHPVKSSQVKS